MSDKFAHITKDISTQLAKMRKEMPEVMSGFSAIAQAATKEGALDKKTKELIAMALAMATPGLVCIASLPRAVMAPPPAGRH